MVANCFVVCWKDAAGSHFGSVCVIKNGLNLGKTVLYNLYIKA